MKSIPTQRLTDNNFTIKLNKCAFLQTQVPFLGFIISGKGSTPGPIKFDLITEFEAPKNKRQLQSFLGICNYYRQFNVRHSVSVDKLRELLKKESVWQWSSEYTMAFEKMKEDFRNCIMLKHVIPNAPFRLWTDASDRGVAGILYQIGENGDHNIIAIVSRCLNRAECNYTTTEKELLAVIYSIEKFRAYLIGVHFTVLTDHQWLTILKSTNFQNARITRWTLFLQQFSFTIEFCRLATISSLIYLAEILRDVSMKKYRINWLSQLCINVFCQSRSLRIHFCCQLLSRCR